MVELREDLLESISKMVDGLGLKLTRDQRIVTAIQTPVKDRTAEQAALVAVGRLIGAGTFV